MTDNTMLQFEIAIIGTPLTEQQILEAIRRGIGHMEISEVDTRAGTERKHREVWLLTTETHVRSDEHAYSCMRQIVHNIWRRTGAYCEVAIGTRGGDRALWSNPTNDEYQEFAQNNPELSLPVDGTQYMVSNPKEMGTVRFRTTEMSRRGDRAVEKHFGIDETLPSAQVDVTQARFTPGKRREYSVLTNHRLRQLRFRGWSQEKITFTEPDGHSYEETAEVFYLDDSKSIRLRREPGRPWTVVVERAENSTDLTDIVWTTVAAGTELGQATPDPEQEPTNVIRSFFLDKEDDVTH